MTKSYPLLLYEKSASSEKALVQIAEGKKPESVWYAEGSISTALQRYFCVSKGINISPMPAIGSIMLFPGGQPAKTLSILATNSPEKYCPRALFFVTLFIVKPKKVVKQMK